MEPPCLIMSLLCRLLNGGFIRLFFNSEEHSKLQQQGISIKQAMGQMMY